MPAFNALSRVRPRRRTVTIAAVVVSLGLGTVSFVNTTQQTTNVNNIRPTGTSPQILVVPETALIRASRDATRVNLKYGTHELLWKAQKATTKNEQLFADAAADRTLETQTKQKHDRAVAREKARIAAAAKAALAKKKTEIARKTRALEAAETARKAKIEAEQNRKARLATQKTATLPTPPKPTNTSSPTSTHTFDTTTSFTNQPKSVPSTSPRIVSPPPPSPTVAPGTARAIGYRLMLAHGWDKNQWPALDALWQRESNWTVTALNPTSGATGIPQSLPGNKMASHGKDWLTNPKTQIAWGLDYIESRYGTPQNAWIHSEQFGWY